MFNEGSSQVCVITSVSSLFDAQGATKEDNISPMLYLAIGRTMSQLLDSCNSDH